MGVDCWWFSFLTPRIAAMKVKSLWQLCIQVQLPLHMVKINMTPNTADRWCSALWAEYELFNSFLVQYMTSNQKGTLLSFEWFQKVVQYCCGFGERGEFFTFFVGYSHWEATYRRAFLLRILWLQMNCMCGFTSFIHRLLGFMYYYLYRYSTGTRACRFNLQDDEFELCLRVLNLK